MKPAVFLDRDGTLNGLPAAGEYVRSPEQVELLRGAAHAVGMLRRAGYLCVIASNQRGVALGLMTEDELEAVDARVRALIGGVDAAYYCTHSIGDECDCRKPEPGLIHSASRELGLSLAGSWFVGDTWMDAAAGRAAGCRTIMVGPEHRTAAELPEDRRPDHAVPDLLAAARIILAAPLAPEAPIAVGGAA